MLLFQRQCPMSRRLGDGKEPEVIRFLVIIGEPDTALLRAQSRPSNTRFGALGIGHS